MADLEQSRSTAGYRPSYVSLIEALWTGLTALDAGDEGAIPGLLRLARVLTEPAPTGESQGIADLARSVLTAEDHELNDRVKSLVRTLRRAIGHSTDELILVVTPPGTEVRNLAARLRGPNRRILHAATVAAARNKASKENVGLVVLDVFLPDGDGRNLLKELRDQPRTSEVPVIVVSALTAAHVKAECMALGANHYLVKPYNLNVLATVAAALLQPRPQTEASPVGGASGTRQLVSHQALRKYYQESRQRAGSESTGVCVTAIHLEGPAIEEALQGRGVGKVILHRVAGVIATTLGAGSLASRWLGPQLVAVFGDSTNSTVEKALAAARLALQGEVFPPVGQGAPVSFSAGSYTVSADMTLEQAVAKAAASLDAAKRAPEAPVDATRKPRLRILVADDDDDSALILKHLLERAGYDVLHCRDGTEALEVARGEPLAACLLDIGMPKVDGLTVLKRLRGLSRFDNVPIIMLTAVRREDVAVEAFQNGADDYLTKPLHNRELIARLERMLKGRRVRSPFLGTSGTIGLSGAFKDNELLEMLQMLSLKNQDGRLSVRGDPLTGHLDLAGGCVVGASSSSGRTALQASIELLTVWRGRFEFLPRRAQDETSDDSVSTPVDEVLMEVMRRREENS
ncbi:response regulator [Planctomycetota bacterium]